MKVIIIGGGQVGSYIAKLLMENKCEVKVVERREMVLNKLASEFPSEHIVMGNGTDASILEQAGINSADAVVAVTGQDEVNLVASTIAKYEYGISRVIARVNNPKNEWLFDMNMGVDVKVNQANLLARIVVDEIDLTNMFTLMKLNQGKHSIIQVKVAKNSASAGKTIKELSIPAQTILIAIFRNHEVIVPYGDTKILGDDSIMALTDDSGQVELNKLLFK